MTRVADGVVGGRGSRIACSRPRWSDAAPECPESVVADLSLPGLRGVLAGCAARASERAQRLAGTV